MLLLINFIRKLISTVYGISYNILYTIAIIAVMMFGIRLMASKVFGVQIKSFGLGTVIIGGLLKAIPNITNCFNHIIVTNPH